MLNSIVLRNKGREGVEFAIRCAGAFMALLAVVCFSATAALGQCTLGGTLTTWTDGNGDWNTSGNWDSGVPNSSTNACITDGTSAVTLSTTGSVDSLQLGSGNALTLGLGAQLSVYGAQIINAGQIIINGGGNSNAFLYITGATTLSGGGTVNLNTTTSGGGGNAYLWLSGGAALTNADNTIQGEGIIYNSGATLINQVGGTIDANSTGSPLIGTLSLEYGNVTNAGLMEATGSGTLELYSTVVNNAGGKITANGANAVVQFDVGTVIQGGTLNTLNGGTLGSVAGSSATLDGSTGAGAVTLSSGSTYTVAPTSSTNLYGSIINNGTFQVNGGGNTNAYLYVPGSVILSGGGTVNLSTTTTGGGGNAYLYLQNGATLDNVDNTIQGEGIIYNNGTTLINEANGIINANSAGGSLLQSLAVEYGTVNNTGLLEATNNGQLQLYQTTVNNAGGNITASGSGASVQLWGSDIVGGTLNTLNGGTLGSVAGYSATLDGSTGAGAVTLSSGSTYTVAPTSSTNLYGSIINNGSFQVNGGGNTNAYLYVPGNVTLTGGGTVNLNTTTTGGGGDAFLYLQNGATLDNVDNTIQGEGFINNSGIVINNHSGGIINANSVGSPLLSYLQLQYGTVNNTGLLEATNNGQLALYATTVNNAGGNITANGSGASVLLYSSTIQGGTLNNNGAAFFGTPNGYFANLDGSTAAGALTLNGSYTTDYSSNTYLYGSIINNGNLQVNGGGNANGTLYIPTNVTLTGGGTVTLNTTTNGGGGYAFLYPYNSSTLDNVDNTIQGEGYINNAGTVINNHAGGIINANSAGSPLLSYLQLQYGTVNNAGLLEATNNGQLVLYSTTVNNAGGNITGNGSGAWVQLYDATIQGGTLNNNGAFFFGTPNGYSAYLDGSTGAGALTVNGTYTTDYNANTYLYGSIINNGNLQVNGGGNTNANLYIPTNVTLTGGGTVNLITTTAGGGGAAFLYLYNSSTLDNVDNTIQGEGYIYNAGTVINNHAGGIINANSAGSPLLSYLQLEYGTVNNLGLLEATNNGQLELYDTTVNNAGGNITANGSGAMVQLDGSTIQGGTLNNNSAAFFGTPNGYNAYLDGSTAAGAVTLNGTYTTDYNASTYLYGSIINNGNLQVNGGANTNAYLYIPTDVTLTGGGTVTLSTTTSGGGGSAWLYLYNASTLDNVDNTVQGEGIIYNNGTTVLNEAGGTILANSTGSPFINALTIEYGTVTNNGTLQVNDGNLLHLYQAVLTNFSGNTLAGGTYIMNGTSSGATLQIDYLGNTGGEIVNNAANIVLNGPNSAFVDAAGLDALANFQNNTAAGNFTIENGRNLTTPGAFSNAGTVTVGPHSILTTGGAFSNTGTVTVGMAGAAAGQFGVLNVTGGNVTLEAGSELGINLVGSFNPVGNTYTIVTDTGGTISGTFANAPASGEFIIDGINWTAAYNSNSIILDGESEVGSLITATWNNTSSGNGHWTTATEWNCNIGPFNCVPNNDIHNVFAAVLDNPGNMLTLDGTDNPTSVTINDLTLTAGTLDIASGASLTVVDNGITNIPTVASLIVAGTTNAVAGLTSVEGALTLGNGQTTSVTPGGGTLTNSGTVNVQQGSTLAVTGALTNSGAVNTGTDGSASNTINVSGLLANSGTITLGGTKGAITATGGLTNTNGTVNLSGSGDTLSAASFTNTGGSVFVGHGENVNVTNNYTQSDGGATLEVNGTLAAVTAFINGGTVSGSGLINAAVQNMGGNVIPIDPAAPSKLTLASYSQGAGGTLTIDITGNGAGQLSLLDVLGSASLDGTVDLDFVGFTPANGETFTFLMAGDLSGVFANVDFSGFTCGTCTLNYVPGTNGSVTLDINGGTTATPEPSAVILFGTALAMAAFLGLRKVVSAS